MNLSRKILIVILFAFVSSSASAVLTIRFSESGSDVIITAAGTVDLTGASFVTNSFGEGSIRDFGVLNADPNDRILNTNAGDDIYNIGTGNFDLFTSDPQVGIVSTTIKQGDSFGIYMDIGQTLLYLPDGYTSGTPVSGSMTLENTTIADLAPVIQTVSWGASANQKVRLSYPGWAGYAVDPDGQSVDTGDFLGWINILHAPYIYVFDLETYIYLPEELVNQSGGWGFTWQ